MRHDISYIIELVRYNIIVITITVYYNITVYGVGPNSPTCPEKRLFLENASESIPKIIAIASIFHTIRSRLNFVKAARTIGVASASLRHVSVSYMVLYYNNILLARLDGFLAIILIL